MKLRAILACAGIAFLLGCSTLPRAKPHHVLLVGNSVVYWHDVGRIASELDPAIAVDTVAAGGATVQQSNAAELLSSSDYDAVAVQERGGDVLCLSDPGEASSAPCAGMVAAHHAIAMAAKIKQGRPLLLGTYQTSAEVSPYLESAEKQLVQAAGFEDRIPTSEAFQLGRRLQPGFDWLDVDGSHPGADTSAIIALMLVEKIQGRWSRPRALSICRYEVGRSGAAPTHAVTSLVPADEGGCRSLSLEHVAALIRIAVEAERTAGKG